MKSLIFDLEANGLDPSKVTSVWCIVAKDLETEEVFRYEYDSIPLGINKLAEADRLIGHNIIGYDMRVLDLLHGFKYPGELIDTLVLSRLLNPDRSRPYGYKGRGAHSLEAWGVRMQGEQKVAWDKWDEWHPTILVRCESDVDLTYRTYKALTEEAMQ